MLIKLTRRLFQNKGFMTKLKIQLAVFIELYSEKGFKRTDLLRTDMESFGLEKKLFYILYLELKPGSHHELNFSLYLYLFSIYPPSTKTALLSEKVKWDPDYSLDRLTTAAIQNPSSSQY